MRPPAEQLGELADLGVTVIEVMPLADFPAASAGATMACACLRQRGFTAARTISAASSIGPTAAGWA